MNCNSACQWYQQTTRLGCELRSSAAMMVPLLDIDEKTNISLLDGSVAERFSSAGVSKR